VQAAIEAEQAGAEWDLLCTWRGPPHIQERDCLRLMDGVLQHRMIGLAVTDAHLDFANR